MASGGWPLAAGRGCRWIGRIRGGEDIMAHQEEMFGVLMAAFVAAIVIFVVAVLLQFLGFT